MNSSIYRFTLDLHSTQSQISIPVMQGDTSREFHISLSDGGKPYIIEDGCIAKLTIKRPNGSRLEAFCIIKNNTTVVYNFAQNENTAIVFGIHNCDFTLYGMNDERIASPRFTMVVSERVINSDDIVLTDDDLTAVDAMLNKEAERQNAENLRAAAENERKNAETGRQGNENERIEHELSRIANEFARNSAETERQATYEEAKESLTTVITKANEAKASADASKASENNAKTSADASKASEDRAKTLADNTLISALGAADASIKAKASETNAKASEKNAKRYADEVTAAAEATPAYLDYLIHYNFRMQQLSSNYVGNQLDYNKRGVHALGLNVKNLLREDFEGGDYTDSGFVGIHPKATGEFSIEAGAGWCGCLMVSRGITHLTVGHGISNIDMSLFTGSMPFPSLSLDWAQISKVMVQKGRKAELMAMTNWSDLNIEEVEEW